MAGEIVQFPLQNTAQPALAPPPENPPYGAGNAPTADARALYHRLGRVQEILSTDQKKNPAGRTWVYTRCRIQWDDGGETTQIDLCEGYRAGDRVAVILRGGSRICDVNLDTGRRSIIGDRLEGLAALVMFVSVPLCFVLIGIPIYYGVTLYSKVTTKALRRRVSDYLDVLLPRLRVAAPPATAAV